MKKFLRLTLVAILMAVCGSISAQTTFDFDNNYKTLFPNLGESGGTSTAGDITEATSCTVDNIKLTVSAKTSGSYENRIWNKTPRLRMYSGTLTIETTDGKKMSNIDFTTGSSWNAKNTADVGTLNSKKWSGDADKVVFTIAGNSQISSIKVTIAGTVTTYTDVNSVEDLLKNYTAAKENLNLKLTNAKVTYVNTYNTTVNAYVREGNSAIELRTLGIDTPVNSLLNGNIKVDLKFSYGVPYLVANDGTSADDLTVTTSEEAAEPIEATVADILDKKYINDLVTIKNFTFEKDEYQEGKYNYYAKDGDNKILLFDKFNDNVGGVADLTDGETYTVTGIFGVIYKGTPEIIPVKAIDENATAIGTIEQNPAATNAATYNIAGQRVGKSYKGIVIVNGKKHIQ